MDIPFLPFKVLALAPFHPNLETPWPDEPLRVDSANLDRVMEGLGISLPLYLPKDLCPTGGLTFDFKKMRDFLPDGLMENHPFLANILEARKFVQESGSRNLPAEEVYSRLSAWPDLPSGIKFDRPAAKASAPPASAIDDILRMVALPGQGTAPPGKTQPFVEAIDSHLRDVLGHVFADESFRNLEAVWRGLRFLLRQGRFNGDLTLEIVPISLGTLEETLSRLLLRLVNDLPSLVLLDLPLDNSPRVFELLEKLANLSETLLVPAVGWISPKFLYLDTWRDLPRLPFLPHYLEEPPFAKWRSFKKSSSARWMGLTCNRLLVRYPYGKDNSPGRVWFEEPRGLWVGPVWGMGSLVARSLLQTGWPTRFTEWKNVKLEDLPLNPVDQDKNLSTEASFSEERISQFIRAGIIPLVAPYSQDIAFTPAETTVAGSSLAYQLFLSRVTRFLFWCKDHFPKDLEPAGVENGLKSAFPLLWERSGHLTPKSLEISVLQPGSDNPPLVRIVLEPSRQILPSGEKIELELSW